MYDTLGDRMKQYEDCYRIHLPARFPIVIRIDGRAFHTFTKGMHRPFDNVIVQSMQHTMLELCKEIEGCQLGYAQSDEISLLVMNDASVDTQPWFDNNLQKIVSICASIASVAFNTQYKMEITLYSIPASYDFMSAERQRACDKFYHTYYDKVNKATFDARAFILPPNEVTNYFIWRQQDASRNSIQMVARSLYSHKELQGKKTEDLHDMLMEKGINWNDLPTTYKRGSCAKKDLAIKNGVERGVWTIDQNIPIFTQERNYIEQHLSENHE